uniref:Uncharacterized protein LOC111132721 n=1 Tax=Crassostrea virginica TaxID=6565 RepID=A0A8B8E9J5_CRAVI|nr:uncharacterized protein LOC111132721 [Crassostrea virginica]
MANETFDICSSTIVEQLKIQNIPETTKPNLPIFTSCQCTKDDVIKLLGKVKLPDKEPKKRKIKPMEIASTQLKCTGQQMGQQSKKSDMKQILSLSFSVTKVREYRVPGVDSVFHVSVEKSGRLWVSDNKGYLVQTDLQRNLLQEIQTSIGDQGYHTATQDGDLVYTDRDKKTIYRVTPDRKITEFIKTGDWRPLSVHSSRINGDILVGMIKNKEAKVSRYSKAGKEKQNIQRDNQGQKLYSYPYYITENVNGDICASNNHAVVVVNKSGQHRFSYTGQRSLFFPWGICTDVLGHILVCDNASDTVHLLNQDGGFLSVILSPQQGIDHPCGVCVDNENNLHVAKSNTYTVTVYKIMLKMIVC